MPRSAWRTAAEDDADPCADVDDLTHHLAHRHVGLLLIPLYACAGAGSGAPWLELGPGVGAQERRRRPARRRRRSPAAHQNAVT